MEGWFENETREESEIRRWTSEGSVELATRIASEDAMR
jgi:hypothetical protein